MSKEYYLRQIESLKRDIEREKRDISQIREKQANLRLKKSRAAISYQNRLKLISDGIRKLAVKSQKAREWEKYKMENEKLVKQAASHSIRIKALQVRIKRAREYYKRMK